MAELNFSLEKVYWKEEVPVDITPATEPQTVTPEAGQAFNKVNVSAIPAPVLQDKVVTPTKQTQNVRADAGFDGLDEVLLNHGYRHEGDLFRAERPNRDSILFFCHFGVECVILGHLLGISPMPLWHGACALTTSVTTLVTEERRRGIASFRMCGFGDVSHLTAAGMEPSFAARFCETWDCAEERHD